MVGIGIDPTVLLIVDQDRGRRGGIVFVYLRVRDDSGRRGKVIWGAAPTIGACASYITHAAPEAAGSAVVRVIGPPV